MNIEKEREAFSRWVLTHPDNLDITSYEENIMFDAWQAAKAESHKSASLYQWEINNLAAANQQWRDYAAKAQAVPEWFDYTKQSPQIDGNYQIFIKGEQITAKWVSRFGFADPIEGDALRQELITHWAMQPQPPKAQELANESE